MILLAGLGALSLLLLPALARRLGRRMPVASWRRLSGWSVVVGGVGLHLVLLLYATPTVLHVTGASEAARLCERMLGNLTPGGPAAGWIALIVVLVSAGSAAVGYARARRGLAGLRIEPGLGDHFRFDSHDVVVLPTARPVAYSRLGEPPQIVMSEGLVAALGEAGIEVVVRHEAAHIDAGDERLLVALDVVRNGLWWLPGVARGVAVARLAVERHADDDAAGPDPVRRQALADALVAAAACSLPEAAAALSAGEGLEERVGALRGELPAVPPIASAALAGGTLAAVVVAGLAVMGWLAGVQRAVAMAGLCFG